MKPEELKPIVEAWGGVEKFAAILGVKERIVFYWLAGKRNMSQPTANLIRTLNPTRNQKKEQPR